MRGFMYSHVLRTALFALISIQLIVAPELAATECHDTIAQKVGANGGGETPPVSGAGFGDPFKKHYTTLVQEAIAGRCLNQHPDAKKNFWKTLGMVWMFQLGGYFKVDQKIEETFLGKEAAKAVQPEFTPEFPFAIFANTAFIIRVQSEVGCQLMFGGRKEDLPLGWTPREMWQRYRSFAKLTPLAAVSAASMVTLQKLLYVLSDEISERAFGYDLGHYQNPMSWHFARSVAAQTMSIMAFELFFLFPKWAAYETWLMNRGFPGLARGAAALGTKLPFPVSGVPGALAFGTEWSYRLAVPILIDNPLLFELFEEDGMALEELPFARFYVPKKYQQVVFFYPEQWIDMLVQNLPAIKRDIDKKDN